MQSIKHISIPEPCGQNWDDMTPIPGGRHCTLCCKKVTDFTGMTNQQIIDTMTCHTNLCGHIYTWQIESVNRELNTAKPSFFNWKGFGVMASMFLTVPVTSANAQHKSFKYRTIAKPISPKLVVFKTITGTVVDSVDKLPLPGVVICAKGSSVNTVTGLDGKLRLMFLQIPISF